MASTAFTKTGQEFLLNRINYERSATMPYKPQSLWLQRMSELLERLGNPQEASRVIHVAGTKGKGSTCHLTESILRAAGYRTGLYTSPHLEELGERFRIDGRPAPAAEIEAEIAILRPVVQRMDDAGRAPTFFELTTALAFQYFARQSVDFSVVEVGLGGRLDSTNVCDPLVTAITSISYDHTAILGGTLEEIAREKAGIVKRDRPVFTTASQPEVLECIEQIAHQHSAPLFQAGRDFAMTHQPTGDCATLDQFEVTIFPESPSSESPASSPRAIVYSELQLGVHGLRQRDNAALAVAICHHIGELGWPVSPQHICEGLKAAKIPARIEVFSESPFVIVDVAHNEASLAELTTTLSRLFHTRSGTRRRLIFSSSRDKNNEAMLRCAASYFDEIVLTRFQLNPRASSFDDLSQLASRFFPVDAISLCETPLEAWQAAWSQTTPDDLLCVAGSFFIAAELLATVRNVAGTT